MTRTTPSHPARRPNTGSSPATRGGFTLNELLIVIALAVLILALAIPAFNTITGGRSIESAENRIAAYLAVARSEAIGLQQPRGVIFFDDRDTGRVTMAQVYFPPGQTTGVLTLDLFGGRDELALPVGVGLREVPSVARPAGVPQRGYAVVMYDGDGRLLVDQYAINTGSTGYGVALGSHLPGPGTRNPIDTANNWGAIGFTLYDGPPFEEQRAISAAAGRKWLDDNAIPYLINRYSGTLLRSE